MGAILHILQVLCSINIYTSIWNNNLHVIFSIFKANDVDCEQAESWSIVGKPNIYLAAIDNGLSFPFKHPDSWRLCNITFFFFREIFVNKFAF